MTQAICDITTDEVNVDVVVELQADTMVEVANRAGGMEQVFHNNTLIGNGNSVDLGVNTDLIATKEYVDEKVESINTYTKDQIDGKLTAVDAQIDANADAIQKTREDYINADSEIHQILNSHADELTTLRGNQASLGDQVSGIEEKIPGDASATNQLATKADLANVDLDGYVKKSGDTMTGDLVFDMGGGGLSIDFNGSVEIVDTGQIVSVQKHINANSQTYGFTFYEVRNNTSVMQYDMTEQGFICLKGNKFLGTSNYPWEKIYAKKLNNGADISVPSEGGTLARIEDLIDLRADINEADSELQTQITAQAAEIATKQDQLVAGDNIVISGNTISATGAGGGAGFDVQVVQELPSTGQKGIIYLLAKDGAAPDVYDEYVWIESTQTFELIGTTQIDLSNYVKNTDYAAYKNGADRAGVIKVSTILGTNTTSDGYIVATTRSLNQYNSDKATCIIGKGTLENIKDDYVKRGITENTIALTEEEKTAAKNWLGVAEGGGDYLPLSGGTMTGAIDFVGGLLTTSFLAKSFGEFQILLRNSFGTSTSLNFDVTRVQPATDNTYSLGGTVMRWKRVSTHNLYNGADIAIPTAGGTMARLEDITDINNNSINTKDLTVGTDEGTLSLSITAGTATIATNNGLDIAAQTKFDTAPTTDDTTAWADVNPTALVTKQQVVTAVSESGGTDLPDQTGNAGKFLITDGTTASWGGGKIEEYSVAIGSSSSAYSNGVALGNSAKSNSIGGIALGSKTSAEMLATAIGCNAKATAKNAIQLGSALSYVSGHTNSDANTFKVGNANGNFEMMSADGTIPADRMSATAGTTGQVLTKTDTGMAWANASGGDGDIDCGVMS